MASPVLNSGAAGFLCRLVENEIFRQDWRSRKKSEILQYVAVKWASVFLLGILTATAALGINTAVENIAGLKFLWTVKFMQTER
jgi:chloride channel 7